jgi:hypothetical protein
MQQAGEGVLPKAAAGGRDGKIQYIRAGWHLGALQAHQ